MAIESNPFQLVYEALINAALTHPKLAAMIPAANRVIYSGTNDRAPQKREVLSSDFPELALMMQGSPAMNLHNTSCSSTITMQYAFVINTGDFRADVYSFPLQWWILCALAGWKSLLGALQWQGKTFVKNCNGQGIDVGWYEADKNRGLAGWWSVWRCTIDMHFATADLVNELTLP